MESVDRFGLQPHPGTDASVSDLWLDGRATGHSVAGRSLEAQYRTGTFAGYVLFVTDNSPYEEGPHIHLLDVHGEPIEKVTLGRPYQSGIFEGVEVVGTDELRFSFQGSHRLVVRPSAKGIFRPHHLQLLREPTT
jgi:hypothetical protein